jgi:hypothetical protein
VIVRQLIHSLLPRESRPRRIPFGHCRGAVANIDFRWDAGFYFGLHEPELRRHYDALLRQGMRCFDVGMFRGWDALALAQRTGAEVVSFDLNQRCLDMTARFLEPSGFNVRLVKAYLDRDTRDGHTTIDEAASQYFVPDFIKLDVEGGEVDVLHGARRVLKERKPSLVIEVHGEDREQGCIQMLRELDYALAIVDRKRQIFSEARVLAHNRWLVCSTD